MKTHVITNKSELFDFIDDAYNQDNNETWGSWVSWSNKDKSYIKEFLFSPKCLMYCIRQTGPYVMLNVKEVFFTGFNNAVEFYNTVGAVEYEKDRA